MRQQKDPYCVSFITDHNNEKEKIMNSALILKIKGEVRLVKRMDSHITILTTTSVTFSSGMEGQ